MISLSKPLRILIRVVIALTFSLFIIACLIEVEYSGYFPLYKIKVNPLTRLGKLNDKGVEPETGMLRLNVLDNAFFRHDAENRQEKNIFILGTSVAVGMRPTKFSYAGNHYQTYDFAIGGNPIYPTMKIFAILSELKPKVIFWAMNPSQVAVEINPTGGAFGKECLGALKGFKFPDASITNKETCFYHSDNVSHFSWRRVAYNMLWFFTNGHLKGEADEALSLFRNTLSSVSTDISNSLAYALKVKKIRPFTDLGDLQFDTIQSHRQAILSQIAKAPNMPNNIPDFQKDGANHWRTLSNPAVLNQSNTPYAQMFASIIAFAKAKHIKVIFYTTPLAHNMPDLFPKGYYEAYQTGLRKMIVKSGGYYLDEGSLLLGKGSLMMDGFHMRSDGQDMLIQMLIYDAIKNGWLT